MVDTRDIPLGIDLGTTNSGIAYLERGQPVMIANELGHYTIPSVVSFTDTERLVGDAAANQAGCNPKNTIFEMKRLIGRRKDDPTVVNDIKAWPFSVISDSSMKPQIRVRYSGTERDFYPENISAMVLSQLKQTAESQLGHPVSKVVITVPAAFNDAQRQATQDAGRMAGFEVLRVINEPTAAALAYGFSNRIEERENRCVLVFDFGGGTFDVSILRMRNKEYEVVRSVGDVHLGGVTHTERYYTTRDNQTEACIQVIEGENRDTAKNIELDNFVIGGIPKAPARKEGIDVTFVVDANCILEVTACVVSTGQSKGIVIKRNRKQFTDEEIRQHRNMEEDMQRRSQRHARRQKLVTTLQEKAYALQKQPALEAKCQGVLRWLESSENASDEEIEAKIREFEQIEEARNRARHELEELADSLRSNAAVREECDEIRRWMQETARTASEADYKDQIARLKQLSQKRKSRARDRLETRLRETHDKFLDSEEIQELCQATQTWLDESGDKANEDDFLDKLDELTTALQDIFLKS
uniref:Hsp70 family protein n=1 Tax=Mesocestoides corti TaxID=53468 RepID=A0A5K3FXU8_MESCO